MKTPKQVQTRAATFYRRNHRAWLSGQFSGLAINLEPPTGKLAERDDGLAVRSWLDEWNRSTIPAQREDRKLSYLGTYSLPIRVALETPELVAEVAGCGKHWRRINAMIERICEGLGEDVRPRIISCLSKWESWDDATVDQFIDVIRWLRRHDPAGFYIRELPILGVDTKWLEARRSVVETITGALRFKEKPRMLELRGLDPAISFAGVRHWSCPVTEIEELPGERVLMIENHHTFLALPNLPGTVAVFGGGLRAHTLATQIPGLSDKAVLYWGDLDSHGFYILELVRRHLPQATSVLMDLDTARAHMQLAVEEPQPSRFVPQWLTPQETFALEFLRSHAVGGCLRIEQERIVYDYAVEALKGA